MADQLETLELTSGVTAQMHHPKGRHQLIAASILRKLWSTSAADDDLAASLMYQDRFAQLCALTDRIDGVDFFIPSPHDEPESIKAAYEAWLDLDEDVFRAWYDAPDKLKAKRAPNPPELQPGVGTEENPTLPPAENSTKDELSNSAKRKRDQD